LLRRQNIDDALAKLQEIVDAAVLAVTPKEIDPETIKRVKDKCDASHSASYCAL
jgi:peptidyl-tRNA hydrolase ICT1